MADAGDGWTIRYPNYRAAVTVKNSPSSDLPPSSSDIPSSSRCIVNEFWETQPVLQFKDVNEPFTEGPILSPIPVSDVKKEPDNLPSNFEWQPIDIDDDDSLVELHRFLENNFAEMDARAFTYSTEFLRWILCSPGSIKSLHVGVFAKNTTKLVGFISGVPTSIRLKGEPLRVAVVNILCVHKKLRFKKLAPVLIKELARRAQLEDIWQGFYANTYISPTPFSTSYWMDRPINSKKLVDLGLVKLRQGFNTSRLNRIYKIPEVTTTRGFRRMEPADVPAVTHLLQDYLRGFWVTPEVDERFVEHYIVPKEGLVNSYVVENPENQAITDFCSFFHRKTLIKNNPKHSELMSAILFYYASSKTPLVRLMKDLLVMAKKDGCDLIRAHGIMGNETFLDKLLFRLNRLGLPFNYYFYNYRLNGALKPRALGFVAL